MPKRVLAEIMNAQLARFDDGKFYWDSQELRRANIGHIIDTEDMIRDFPDTITTPTELITGFQTAIHLPSTKKIEYAKTVMDPNYRPPDGGSLQGRFHPKDVYILNYQNGSPATYRIGNSHTGAIPHNYILELDDREAERLYAACDQLGLMRPYIWNFINRIDTKPNKCAHSGKSSPV